MKTKTAWITLAVGLVPMLTGTGLTQEAVKASLPADPGARTPAPVKPITISGRVNNDGNTLVDGNGDFWTVANPEVLKDYAGRQVTVKGNRAAGARVMRALSIRPVRNPQTYSARWDDSAFRR